MDGCREHESKVVIGVVPEDLDASGSESGRKFWHLWVRIFKK
jgi:hypothetical protein